MVKFEIDPFRKHRLLEGLDDIGLTLVEAPAIDAFERSRQRRGRGRSPPQRQLSRAHMAKNVQMSIKMEPELRDRFLSVAAERHRPAAQIIRDLMRLYIAESESPNALTAQTLRRSREGDDIIEASDLTDMLKQLGL